ncbi:MAG: chromosomal replication initiator protein DnaA [Fimbriimonadaceae bacterium]|jgi:chromosomal replication initiator protein|nr:chromosomal replication initiator protein DnaA [Fimbriimonadaceae bacterium]
MSNQYSLDDREDDIVLRKAWEQVLARLGQRVPVTVLEKFLRPLKPTTLTTDVAVVEAPGRFVHDWVKDKYIDNLRDALSDELGRPIRIELKAQAREKPLAAITSSKVRAVASIPEPTALANSFRPNERFTFEQFVVGQSNRLAVAGAKAVASSPGIRYNPLFIYGPPGLGKTHLLHAIANEILVQDPHHPVVYLSAQQFAEDFVYALQNNRIDQFRRQQRNVNVWLVDDVQFVAGKDKTQEELFHTFNTLHSMGKQIVLCSDRPPRDLLLMDERLRSRFESGLVADVQMPDTETRCAIVLKKAKQDHVVIDLETAMLLAESVPGNVRILEGALTKIAAEASLEKVPVNRELAQEIVDKHYRNVGTSKPSFDQILVSVSKHFQIDVSEIRGTSRKAPVAHARHVAVFMTREITGDSWKHIGSLFGNRDHTSMMHGYRKIRDLMNRDRETNASVRMLMRDLYPDAP